jgi:hypothetical protein
MQLHRARAEVPASPAEDGAVRHDLVATLAKEGE